MLCLHGSSGACGRTAGLGADYPRYALELAERGYVTIAPDYPLFGENQEDLGTLGYVSGNMAGIWDHMRAVDVLVSLPAVDGERIGCIGSVGLTLSDTDAHPDVYPYEYTKVIGPRMQRTAPNKAPETADAVMAQRALDASKTWKGLRRPLPPAPGRRALQDRPRALHLGPIASGDKTVASKESRNALLDVNRGQKVRQLAGEE
jgi:hypothetical protein